MGITIQQYRCRIGRFLPKYKNIENNIHSQSNNSEEPTNNLNFNLKLFPILKVAILTPFILALLHLPLLQHQEQSYSHPMYPTANLQIFKFNSIIPNGKVAADLESGLIISYGINMLAASSFSMVNNFHSRYYGNRKNQGIKISAWNKGGGYLQNKMPELNNIINGLHPHVLGISEANLKDTHDQNLVHLEDYILHTCPTITNPNLLTSRVVVYTHKSLVVKLRPDLMCLATKSSL